MQRHWNKIAFLIALLMLTLALAGCGGEEPLPTPTPTKTPLPLAASTPAPTDTPTAAPAPTDTPEPTATPAPEDTPTPEGTPTPEPTPTPVAFLQPSQDDVNTRKGPGTSYGRVGQVTRADTLGVYGKSADGNWYKICCVNGQEAWIASQFAQLSGNSAVIAVVEAPPLNAETQADVAPATAGPSGGSSRGVGFVYIGNVVPPVDNPPPGKYYGLCGLRVNRPVREVPPQRSTLAGDTNPLTGLPIDPARLQERIFVARYGNEPAVRSSFGIGAADLVFEELMDDLNTTRFTTIWLGGDAPQIGPLRSYRSTTIQVAQIFDAPMASSGAVGPNQVFAYAAGIEDLDERCYSGPYFNNPAGGGYQNRVLTSSANLRAFMQNNGLNTGVKIKPFTFSDTAPSGGQAANRVVIPYVNRGFYEVEWRFDPATGRYARFYGSARNPLLDGNNGQQVTAANVVIMEVQHDKTDLVEDIVNSYSVRTYIAGREGPATIIRDGVAIQGRWRALDKFSGLELVDAAGNPIPLKPGQTWFQVVPPNYGVTIVG
jgi:predicted small lipoprotein YifL